MLHLLVDLFGVNVLIPHGYCLNWTPSLLWLHGLSDLFIGMSYYVISIYIYYFRIKRNDFPYPYLINMFGLFILACGTTHFLSVVTIWFPVYWIDGIVKALTASIATITAIMMYWTIPLLLKLRSPKQLEEAISIAENKLLIQEEKHINDLKRYKDIIDYTDDAIIGKSPTGMIESWNYGAEKLFGYTANEVIGRSILILFPEESKKDELDILKRIYNGEKIKSLECMCITKNGDLLHVSTTTSPIYNELGILVGVSKIARDITDNKKAEEEINQLAFYDQLTHLPNRRLLLDRLKQAMAVSTRTGKCGAMLFIDLDNFKTLNDTLGHDVGDLLLKEVAIRLERCIREGDTVARLGGDEFVILLEGLSNSEIETAKQTEIVGNKILATLNKPYELKNYIHHNTPSIGVTIINNHNHTFDELFKQADIAMYQAKKAGRNTIQFFDLRMQELVNIRANIENDLRDALFNSEIELYYQVQVKYNLSLNTFKPIGAEVLVRWNSRKYGLTNPSEFIQIAEETGLIISIGLYVFENACKQLKLWESSEETKNFILAINVSSKQFKQSDFVHNILEIVKKYSINTKLIKLELTESLFLDSVEETIIKMLTLNKAGIQFSLDDFGTGYSSLQYLKLLPLNQFKIDKSFIYDIVFNNGDKSMVKSIIAMAKIMELDVIAEGVETHEQCQILLNNGCANFQGYLFGKPMTIENFEKLCNKW